MLKKDDGIYFEHEPLIPSEALDTRYQQSQPHQNQHGILSELPSVESDVGTSGSPRSQSVSRSTTHRRPPRAAVSSSRQHVSSDDGEFLSLVESDEELDNIKEDSLSSSSRQRKFWCAQQRKRLIKQTMALMNSMAKLVLWFSILATAGSIIWYAYELKNRNTEQHLIAWFTAGAFVILGFPVSIYGIFMHLTHYYQPHIQCYIVRILWMVPIYSVESWLCLRFHKSAIYIETLRDCYEAYVLYSFLQFLINVLGGETELILLLKEKSPTRGVHFNFIKCFIKPWVMGQPKLFSTGDGIGEVRWTSPFLTKCKFGVLQYVLLKYFCALITMILEFHHLYKEGDFSPKSGYLYICIIINASQCWALYCLTFFYCATSNELAPIRPIGKFLSVKCLVFFTWWQSLAISILSFMGMIPRYQSQSLGVEFSEEEVAKMIQAFLICLEMFGSAIMHYFIFPHTEFSDNQNAALSSRPLTRHHRLGRHKKHQQRKTRSNSEGTSISSEHSLQGFDLLSSDREISGKVEMIAVENPNSPSLDHNLKATSPSANVNVDSSGLRRHEDGSDVPLVDICSNTNLLTRHQRKSALKSHSGDSDDSKMKKIGGASGFFKALLDSSVPRDVIEDSHRIMKGAYIVEKKTLLHHATASDEYSLFVHGSKGFVPKLHFEISPSTSTADVHRRQMMKKEVVSKRNRRRPIPTTPQQNSHFNRWEGVNESADAVLIPTHYDQHQQLGS